MSGTRNRILNLDDHFPNLDTSHRANTNEKGLGFLESMLFYPMAFIMYCITMIGLIWVVIPLCNICAKHLNTGRAAHNLEWMMSSIFKPSWSWTKDMLKRAGKQTVEWLDELWIVEGTFKHEVLAVAKADRWADLEDTDDNWSMCVDTPSETESNATSRSTNTVPTDRKKSRRVSFSDTVDTASNQEAVASYAKALNQLPVPQDRSIETIRTTASQAWSVHEASANSRLTRFIKHNHTAARTIKAGELEPD